MDELLRETARARRDRQGPAFELPPETARLLRQEVAHAFPEKEPPRRTASWWALLWPRLALIGAVSCAGVAALWWFRSPPGRTLEVASARPGEPKAKSVLLTPAETTPAAPRGAEVARAEPTSGSGQKTQMATEERLYLAKEVSAFDSNASAAPPTPAPAPPASTPANLTANEVIRHTRDLAERAEKSDKPALLTTDSAPASQTEPLMAAKRMAVAAPRLKEEQNTLAVVELKRSAAARELEAVANAPSKPASPTANQSFQFTQSAARTQYRRNLNSPAVPKILDSFTVQLDGETVQIQDGDGSTYRGKLLSFSASNNSITPLAASALSDAGAAAQNLNNSAPAGDLAFRATGVNRTLGRSVVFDGTWKEEPGPALGVAVKDANTPALGQRYGLANQSLERANEQNRGLLNQSAAATNVLWQNSRIEGTVILGPRNTLRIDAQQVAPPSAGR